MDNNTRNGGIGEIAIQQKFISLGCDVCKPVIEGHPYDLVVLWDGKFHKIQIKTTEKIVNDTMTWFIAQHDRSNSQKNKRKAYSVDDAEYFALYCIATNTAYLVPVAEAGKEKISIKLDSYSGIRQKTMHFEKDFQFENYVK